MDETEREGKFKSIAIAFQLLTEAEPKGPDLS